MLARTTITTRLSLALAGVMILSLGLGVTGAVQLDHVRDASTHILDESVSGIRRFAVISNSIDELRVLEARAAVDGETALLDRVGPARAQVGIELSVLGAQIATPEERGLFNHMLDYWHAFLRLEPRLEARSGGTAMERKQILGTCLGGLNQALAKLADYQFQRAAQADRRLGDIVLFSKKIMACANVLGWVVMTMVLVFIRRRIGRPLETITCALSDLAGGKLDVCVPGLERRDEIGAMARAFDVFRLNAVALASAHEQAAAAEQQAQALARHDALTGLPNRVLFTEHLERVLPSLSRGGHVAVLSLDLDGFKHVNDTLGHPAGDALLRQVAARLTAHTRQTDLVARLGGDEFAIIQASAEQPAEAAALADRLIATFAQPFDLDGQRVEIATSIGVVIADAGCATCVDLLRNADIALYRAKSAGRGTSCFFETGMDREIQQRRQLEAELRRALADEQFELHYQPLLDASTQGLIGMEALLRWRHPQRGLIGPAEFIPVAEQTGLIRAIGAWVLARACRDAQPWPAHIKIAVNLSPMQFSNCNLVAEVEHALASSGLAASRLELEITESVLLLDSDMTLAILNRLHALGVAISMDDFGTGYSSLSYLRRFPFNKIKIDQCFVQNLSQDKSSIEIVRAVVSLGRALGMSVLAEGVETEEQSAILQLEGCDQLQGFLFSKPKPLQDIAELIARASSKCTQSLGALGYTMAD